MFSESLCPSDCPACRHRNLTKDESLNRKSDFLHKKLSQFSPQIQNIVSAPDEWRSNYRKKVCLRCTHNGQRWEFGVIWNRKLLPIPYCPVHHNTVNQCMNYLSEVMPPHEVFPLHYYVQSGRQLMLVIKTPLMPDMQWLTEEVKQGLAELQVEGLWVHLNPSAGNKIFMKHRFFLLYGKEYSVDDGMRYGPLSFQQLIPSLYFDSLRVASQFLKAGNQSIMIDLYCGTGYSLREWKRAGAHCAGAELSGEAVDCCRINVPGALIYRGKCHDRIPQLNEFIEQHADKTKLLYVNPPRTGLEPQVLTWIVSGYQPLRMAYLSCSPGTLLRDLNDLCQKGYRVEKIIPYDFFPQTIHVECLALLSKI